MADKEVKDKIKQLGKTWGKTLDKKPKAVDKLQKEEQYKAIDGKIQHTSGAVKATKKVMSDKDMNKYATRLNKKSKVQLKSRAMQESHAQAAIGHIASGNLKEMQSSFLAALTEKAITKLDDHKINVGKSFFDKANG